VIGYRAAFGRLPYEGDALGIINGHLRGDASFAGTTSCGGQTLGVIKKMMHSDPNARYDSVESLLSEARLALKTLNHQADSDHGPQIDSNHGSQVASDHGSQAVPAPGPENSALMEIAKSMERRFDDIAKAPTPVAASSTQFLRRLFTGRKTPQA
jgi:hypothetical protein